MDCADIIDIVRKSWLYDAQPEYLWTDAELVQYAVQAEIEACRRQNLIVDKTTEDYCTIATVAGTSTYAIDAKVIKIIQAKLDSQDLPLAQVTRVEMNDINPYWQSANAQQGTPKHFMCEAEGELILIPTPALPDTLRLIVSRYPAEDVTLATAFEIPERFHLDLIPYICHLAYLKPTKLTYNLDRSTMYGNMFTAIFGPRQPASMETAQRTAPFGGNGAANRWRL